jgi:isohexenylglutaconyl-CoA hydratase
VSLDLERTRETLALRREGMVLHLELNRPQVRNAMSFAMVEELIAVFDDIAEDRGVRVVVIRGAGGNLCAGGDIKDMAGARSAKREPGEPDPMATSNRRFGVMIAKIETAPQAVAIVAEGAVMGGGFGLLCVSDLGIAVEGAKLRLPETTLGIPPAQIAPFVVRRIGLTQARRLAVTGGRLDAKQALALGLVHEYAANTAELGAQLDTFISQVRRCAPVANAVTKSLLLRVGHEPLDQLLDSSAEAFAEAARGAEAMAGMGAFLQKQSPPWAQQD